MALRASLIKMNSQITAAANNTLKTQALGTYFIQAVAAELSKTGALTPGQQCRVNELASEFQANAATIRIALYGA